MRARQPADHAAWIWHPHCAVGSTAFLRFRLEFELPVAAAMTIHVSADQRYQLRIDGALIGGGPDRGYVTQWPVASHELKLSAGKHEVESLVWWIADATLAGLRADPAVAGAVAAAQTRPPVAQSTWRGGFLFAADEAHASLVNTGRAPWRVVNLTDAVRLTPPAFPVYHDIGPEFEIDAGKWTGRHDERAVVVAGNIPGNPHGVQRPGWRLQPSGLPEQVRKRVEGGRPRARVGQWTDGPWAETSPETPEMREWAGLLRGTGEITVPPRTECTLVWDFERYICGYAHLTTTAGVGARVRIDWAEGLFVAPSREALGRDTAKGERGEISGKIFAGFGDEYLPAGEWAEFPALWWRSGRYLRVQVRTAEEPLVIREFKIVATGYPLGEASTFSCDQAEWNRLAARCEATTRACAHEVWADSPYYEQMAYVGDSRLAGLMNYALFADDRLSRRMLALFDESRANHGLVAMRAPGDWTQVSVTYSLWWVAMVRDFAWWRDDAAFVRSWLRGVRAMLDEVQALTDVDGLLKTTPGWPFVDWVPGWDEGCGPGVRAGDSSIVNLHWVLALKAYGELEAHFGAPELAARAERWAARVGREIVAQFWDEPRGLLADTHGRHRFSEHAQALGILAGLPVPGGSERWVEAWLKDRDLTPPTAYFSFYVLEALGSVGRTDEIGRRIAAAGAESASGLLTMPEAPEPTRSDCHGWSAQWRWHLAATVAGVRPLAPGFARVGVTPRFGPLRSIEATVRHPRGTIGISLQRDDRRLSGWVVFPTDIRGELQWNGAVHPLQAGENRIEVG